MFLTSTSMPSNMAMDEPRSEVVWLEGDRHIPPGRDHDDVSAWRIVKVPRLAALDVVVWAGTLPEQYNITPVPVDRVSQGGKSVGGVGFVPWDSLWQFPRVDHHVDEAVVVVELVCRWVIYY